MMNGVERAALTTMPSDAVHRRAATARRCRLVGEEARRAAGRTSVPIRPATATMISVSSGRPGDEADHFRRHGREPPCRADAVRKSAAMAQRWLVGDADDEQVPKGGRRSSSTAPAQDVDVDAEVARRAATETGPSRHAARESRCAARRCRPGSPSRRSVAARSGRQRAPGHRRRRSASSSDAAAG